MTIARGPGRVRILLSFYGKSMRLAATNQLQYRASVCLLLAGMVLEAVIYMYLWQAVVHLRGGELQGWDSGELAAYFIVWTLVRNMSTAFLPHGFEERIRSGHFSTALLRPLHPIHSDIAELAGRKLATFVFWVPVAAAMVVVFRPSMTITVIEAATFGVALCAAFLIRSLYLWLLGMITFWTTRATGLFDIVLAVELLMSGRLMPLGLLPPWVESVGDVLPFRWVFSFPIESVVGEYPTSGLVHGLAMQAAWIAVGVVLVGVTWRFAVRRHAAVGN